MTTSTDADRKDSTLPVDLLAMINAEVSLDPEEPIDGSTDLLLTGLVDSLGVMTIVGWLEDRLEIEIDPSDIILDHFQTVDQMVGFVKTLSG